MYRENNLNVIIIIIFHRTIFEDVLPNGRFLVAGDPGGFFHEHCPFDRQCPQKEAARILAPSRRIQTGYGSPLEIRCQFDSSPLDVDVIDDANNNKQRRQQNYYYEKEEEEVFHWPLRSSSSRGKASKKGKFKLESKVSRLITF
jgi:hypothetical protein